MCLKLAGTILLKNSRKGLHILITSASLSSDMYKLRFHNQTMSWIQCKVFRGAKISAKNIFLGSTAFLWQAKNCPGDNISHRRRISWKWELLSEMKADIVKFCGMELDYICLKKHCAKYNQIMEALFKDQCICEELPIHSTALKNSYSAK